MSDEGSRQNPRFALDASITLAGTSGTLTGRCLNLSSGGLCAEMPEGVALGAPMDLSVTLVFDIDTFSEPLILRGRAVWSTPLGACHQVGFQFLKLSADQEAYLAMFLRFLEDGRAARRPPAIPDKDVFS